MICTVLGTLFGTVIALEIPFVDREMGRKRRRRKGGSHKVLFLLHRVDSTFKHRQGEDDECHSQ
jgi:hypothetical protein